MNASAERQHSFTWSDPSALAAAARRMDGLSFLQAGRDGTIPMPPIFDLFEMRFDDVAEGRVVFSMPVREYQYNPIGTVHGGVMATILDSVAACCIHTTLSAEEMYTTLELKINYVCGVTAKLSRMRAEGNVIHRGRRMATSEGKLYGDDGKLYAHASSTCMIMPVSVSEATKP
ncbi:MAG: PaaI family thioesterase [Pseudomonadota bacterium]